MRTPINPPTDTLPKAGFGRPLDLDAGRRAFIRSIGLGVAGATILAGTSLAPSIAEAAANDRRKPTDAQILNFALNLEYLEAEFYLRAAFGRGLSNGDTGGRGRRGPVDGGRQVQFDTQAFREYAEEIANDEEQHVKFLRSALGRQRVARPAINIDEAFTSAARAAGLVGPNDSFDAYANENNFLLAAFIFEDVGVTAYMGAAGLISSQAILEAAAGILAVEAYHAGIIRTTLFSLGLIQQAGAISDARDSLDGRSDKDQGINRGSKANLVPANANALAFSRSAGQVLNIVYLNPEGDPGGFFPRGVNG